jgi:exodeoxyribonuclease VII small subunit
MPPIRPAGRVEKSESARHSLETKMAENESAGSAMPAEIAAMSFEQALAELQELVKRLEKGDNKLDDAIKSYERGALLKRHCEAKLREAQMKVEKIVLGADGSVGVQPMDSE